jgi:NAD(P)-dependent dehydrogenase (short-subunit alcohol dehydrogenase family)
VSAIVHPALRSVWNSAKQPHTLRLGPVSLIARLSASVRVSNNRRRHLRQALASWLGSEAARPPSVSVAAEPSAPPPHVADQVGVVVGVGPGLGRAIVRRLTGEGVRVAMLARNAERLDPLAAELRATGDGVAVAYGCDATQERSVQDAMTAIHRDLGTPDLVVYCVEGFHPGQSLDVEVAAFEDSWRQTCLGAFIVAREAARTMAVRGHGRPGYLNLAVGKFGVRGMAQVMAKELSPLGVHVAHLLIDGGIEEEETPSPEGRVLLDPDALAEIVWSLHAQPRRAWTHELDVRAGDEAWWQRC